MTKVVGMINKKKPQRGHREAELDWFDIFFLRQLMLLYVAKYFCVKMYNLTLFLGLHLKTSHAAGALQVHQFVA